MNFNIDHKNTEDRISNIICKLINEYTFFGMFLATTKIIEDYTFPTAATDGAKIYYNPSFLVQLEDVEVKAVFVHEVLHIIYSHCNRVRRGIRNPKKWGQAADYNINWEIHEMDHSSIRLPNNIIIDGAEFKIFLDAKYKNLSVETIYDMLHDSNDDGIDVHFETTDEEELKAVSDRIKAAYDNTSAASKSKLSAGILQAISRITNTAIPWTRIFQRYIGHVLTRDNYSYSLPNRRFAGSDLYMPSLSSYGVGRVVVAIDISGSIGKKEVEAFVNELYKIAGLIQEVVVISCNTAVRSFDTINHISQFNSIVDKISWGGGTSFVPPFEELKKRGIVPDVFIYLTDAMGEFPKNKPHYPVIWVITTQTTAPFGKTIQMNTGT